MNEQRYGAFLRSVPDDAPSVLELTYRRLREAIMAGAFAPGEHIRQESIARKLGISRGPAREALNRLAAEGLVQLRPRRGYIVETLDPDELEDIFDLRIELEGKAGRLATLKRTPADVEAVRNILERMEALDISMAGNLAMWSVLNREFHGRIIASSGRRHLIKLTSSLRDSAERYLRFETSSLDSMPNEHRLIFEAFAAGDAELTGELSRRHCENVFRSLMGRLTKERSHAIEQGSERASGRDPCASPIRSDLA